MLWDKSKISADALSQHTRDQNLGFYFTHASSNYATDGTWLLQPFAPHLFSASPNVHPYRLALPSPPAIPEKNSMVNIKYFKLNQWQQTVIEVQLPESNAIRFLQTGSVVWKRYQRQAQSTVELNRI